MLFITNVFLQLNFGTEITPYYINIIGETNPRETKEFLSTFLFNKKGLLTIGCLAFIVFMIVLTERYSAKLLSNRQALQKMIIGVATPFILIGLSFPFIYYSLYHVKSMNELDIWGNQYGSMFQDSYSRLIFSCWAPVATRQEINTAIERTMSINNDHIVSTDDSLNVIFIIGESFIKYHSPFYGYSLNTNPKLESEKDNIFAFNDIVARYNTTSLSLKNLMSCNSMSDGEHWSTKPYFPAIFRRAGFRVYFWDNQQAPGDATWDFTLNAYLHNKQLEEQTYNSFNDKVFPLDGELVRDFLKNKFPTMDNSLTIIHLWGQHVDAKSRYPQTKEWMHFTKDSITERHSWLTDGMKQDIAEYDNATRYNDWVVGQIIDRYKNSDAVMVYISDHGEEVYDWRSSKGRNSTPMSKGVLRYQYDIPMFVWCSDKYKAKHPEVLACIKQSLNQPMPSDIVCNMLFHLAGIHTRYYRPRLDILSPKYRCPKRIVQDHFDYDAIMKGK